MNTPQLGVSSADHILAPVGRVMGRMIGRTSDCGIDCDVSEFDIAEYLILAIVFILVFLAARKIRKLIADKCANGNP